MNCRTVQPLLSAYADNELTGAQSLAVRDHLRTCTSCKFESERLALLKQHLQGLRTFEPPAGLEARLQRAILSPRRPNVGGWTIFGLLAASSVAAAYLAVRLADRPTVREQPIAQETTHRMDVAADTAYLGGSDPIGGGVPVVTVGYAGGH